MGSKIETHRDLIIYRKAFSIAGDVYRVSKGFPHDERYSLTDQARRSSRSVCANLAEAWRKRRYEAAFVAKLSDSEAEAAETQVWLEFALDHRYIDESQFQDFVARYEEVLRMLVAMMDHPEKWLLRRL